MKTHDFFTRLIDEQLPINNSSEETHTLFISPETALLGHGISLCSADLPHLTVAEQIEFMFQHTNTHNLEPIVMGAIPFSDDSPAALLVPKVLHRPNNIILEKLRSNPPVTQTPISAVTVNNEGGKAAFHRHVDLVLKMIEEGVIDKLVLSRYTQLHAKSEIDIETVLHRLLAAHPKSYLFSIPNRLSNSQASGTFVGASPELLVSRFGDRVYATPLAGSAAVDPNPTQQQSQIVDLASSQKDLREHAYTAGAVCDVLGRFCDEIDCPKTPIVLRAGPVYHLASPISARLKSQHISSVELAQALHPTPAVGGMPMQDTAKHIRSIEGRPRGLYAGMVGWCDQQGNGEWAVSLRCANITGCQAQLFAGAGIVAGSTSEAEFMETETKLKAMQSALNLDLTTTSIKELNTHAV